MNPMQLVVAIVIILGL